MKINLMIVFLTALCLSKNIVVSQRKQQQLCSSGAPTNCILYLPSQCTSNNFYPCLYCASGYTLATANNNYICQSLNSGWPIIDLQKLATLQTNQEAPIGISNTADPCNAISIASLKVTLQLDVVNGLFSLINSTNTQIRTFKTQTITQNISSSWSGLSCIILNKADFTQPGKFVLQTNTYGTIQVSYQPTFPDCLVKIALPQGAGYDTLVFSPWVEMAYLTRGGATPIIQDTNSASTTTTTANVPSTTIPFGYILSNSFFVESNFQFSDADLNICQTNLVICNAQNVQFSLCQSMSVLGVQTYVVVFTLRPLVLLNYITANDGVTPSIKIDPNQIWSSDDANTLALGFNNIYTRSLAGLVTLSTKLWLDKVTNFATDSNTNYNSWKKLIFTDHMNLIQLWYTDLMTQFNLNLQAAPGAPGVPAPNVIVAPILANLISQQNQEYQNFSILSFQGLNSISDIPLTSCALQLYPLKTQPASLSYLSLITNSNVTNPQLNFGTNLPTDSDYILNWSPLGPSFNYLCTSIQDSNNIQHETNLFSVYPMSITIAVPTTKTSATLLPPDTELIFSVLNLILPPDQNADYYLRVAYLDVTSSNQNQNCFLLDGIDSSSYTDPLSIIIQPVQSTGIYFLVQANCDATCSTCSGPSAHECLSCSKEYLFWESQKRCLLLEFNSTEILSNCLNWNADSNNCSECNTGFTLINNNATDFNGNTMMGTAAYQCILSSLTDAAQFCSNYTTLISSVILSNTIDVSNLIQKLISDLQSVQTQLTEQINIRSFVMNIYDALRKAQVQYMINNNIVSSLSSVGTTIPGYQTSIYSLSTLGFAVPSSPGSGRLLQTNQSSSLLDIQFDSTPSAADLDLPTESAFVAYTSCSSDSCDPPFCDNSIGPWSKLSFVDATGNALPSTVMSQATFSMSLALNLTSQQIGQYSSFSMSYWNSSSQYCDSSSVNLQSVTVTSDNQNSYANFLSRTTGGYYVFSGVPIELQPQKASKLWLLMLLLIIPLILVPFYICHKRFHKRLTESQQSYYEQHQQGRIGRSWMYSYCNPLILLWVMFTVCVHDCCCFFMKRKRSKINDAQTINRQNSHERESVKEIKIAANINSNRDQSSITALNSNHQQQQITIDRQVTRNDDDEEEHKDNYSERPPRQKQATEHDGKIHQINILSNTKEQDHESIIHHNKDDHKQITVLDSKRDNL